MISFNAPPGTAEPGESISAMIAARAAATPDKDALVCDDERVSWAEFDARVNRIANALIAAGLTKGDTVAALSRNSVEFAELFVGTVRAGCCIVPLSTMASAEALERMVIDSEARIFAISQELRALAPFAETLNGLAPNGLIALDFTADGWQNFHAWRDAAPATNPGIAIGLEDSFNIIYSSGTTGVPKGIVHSNGVRTHTAKLFGAFGFDETSVTLLSTPLYSNTTIVAFLPTLVMGGTVVLMGKFDVRGYLELVERERVTETMLVPVQYHRIMAYEDFDAFDLSSMRLKQSTSAPLRPALKRDIVERFPGRLLEVYGLTEGGGGTILDAGANPDKLASVGQPRAGTIVKIIDEAGNEVAQGEVGEIVARSPTMMTGYHGRDDLTDAILWRDAAGDVYFRSGDMGRFDEDGFLFLSDRIKDMINSGGMNIFANDLELVLLDHPDVIDAAVIAAPSESWGETPVGLVVVKPGSETAAEAIKDWTNAKLSKFQRLSAVDIREALPRSSIGKILKRELRAPYWEGVDE